MALHMQLFIKIMLIRTLVVCYYNKITTVCAFRPTHTFSSVPARAHARARTASRALLYCHMERRLSDLIYYCIYQTMRFILRVLNKLILQMPAGLLYYLYLPT